MRHPDIILSPPGRPRPQAAPAARGRAAGAKALLLVFLALALLVLAWGAMPPPAHAATIQEATGKALDYLHGQWRDDGGFASTGGGSDVGMAPWAVLAISAAGYAPGSWHNASTDLVSQLAHQNLQQVAANGMNKPAFYAKLILAFIAAGRPDLALSAGNPALNPIQTLLTYQDSASGRFQISADGAADISTTIWAILALEAAGRSAEAAPAVDWLLTVQADDGGFAMQTAAAGSTDVDNTSAAIQALIAAGVPADDPVIQNALGFLQAHQRPDGGFSGYGSDASTAESTSWAVQALRAAGQDPEGWTTASGATPLSYLLSLQRENGCFEHYAGQVSSPVMTTTQVIIALAGTPFPFASPTNGWEAPDYRPRITSFTPAAGGTVGTSVSVVATFEDNEGGVGLDQERIRLVVDGEERDIQPTVAQNGSLNVQLTDLAAGSHTFSLTVGDLAGHIVSEERTVTVTTTTTTSNTTITTQPTKTTTKSTTAARNTATTRRATTVAGTGTGTGNANVSNPSSRTTVSRNSASRSTTTLRTGAGATKAGTARNEAQNSGDGMISGTAMEAATGSSFGQAADGSDAVTGQQVPEGEASRGAAAGLLVGGIAALLPLGAGLSLVSHRRRTNLLGDVFTGLPTGADEVIDAGGPLPPADVAAAQSRAAWVGFQGRLRHKLAHLPFPD